MVLPEYAIKLRLIQQSRLYDQGSLLPEGVMGSDGSEEFFPYFLLHKDPEYLELKTMSKSEAIIVFKFRTRMSPFSENFRSGKQPEMCPMCLSHFDTQEYSFYCTKMKTVVQIKGKYQEIFSSNISQELANTLANIYTYRKEYNN